MSCLPTTLRPSVSIFAAVLAFFIAGALHASAQTFTVVHSFTGDPDGANPAAPVVFDSEGNLYGTTVNGGIPAGDRCCGPGVIYKVTADGTETVLVHFGTLSEATSYAPLIWDTKGNLYGTNFGRGCSTACGGALFELSAEGVFHWLFTFKSITTDGASPLGGLVTDAEGNFYGTTYEGGAYYLEGTYGGTVFKATKSNTETVLHSFGGPGDGAQPQAGLIIDSQGNLYGTTPSGGSSDDGIVFKLAPDGTETILHNFTGGKTDGVAPIASLLMDSEGNLYGTTLNGGLGACNSGCGTVFKITVAGQESLLHRFAGGDDGALPAANLIMDAKGFLYGTTAQGGGTGCSGTGCGTIFKIGPGGESVLYRFTGEADGAAPEAGLVFDAEGNLWGTNIYGGITNSNCTNGCGVLFKLKP
jgi:uncharacterized repeat protein (TIGR03803 family)